MIFVNARCVVSGRTIAVPKHVISYIAVWTGENWILNGVSAWNVLSGVRESFLL